MNLFRYMKETNHLAFGKSVYEKLVKLYAEQQLLPKENVMDFVKGRPSQLEKPEDMFEKVKTH